MNFEELTEFNLVKDHSDNGVDVLDEMASFFARRAAIEAEYARKLRALVAEGAHHASLSQKILLHRSQKSLAPTAFEVGQVKTCWEAFEQSQLRVADHHADLSRALEQAIVATLTNDAKKQAATRRAALSDAGARLKAHQDAVDECDKLRALNDKLLAEFADSERGVQRASAEQDGRALGKLAGKRDALRERLASTRQRLAAADAAAAAAADAYFGAALPAALRTVADAEAARVARIQHALEAYVELEQTVAVTTTRSVLPELSHEISALDGPVYVRKVADLIHNTPDPAAPQPQSDEAESPSIDVPVSPESDETAGNKPTDESSKDEGKMHAAVQRSKEYLKISTWRDASRKFTFRRSKEPEALEDSSSSHSARNDSGRESAGDTANDEPRRTSSSAREVESAQNGNEATTTTTTTTTSSAATAATTEVASTSSASTLKSSSTTTISAVAAPTSTTEAQATTSTLATPNSTTTATVTAATTTTTTTTPSAPSNTVPPSPKRQSWGAKMRAAMDKVKTTETVSAPTTTDASAVEEDLEDIPL